MVWIFHLKSEGSSGLGLPRVPSGTVDPPQNSSQRHVPLSQLRVPGTFSFWLTCLYLVFSSFCLLETCIDLSSAVDSVSHSFHCCSFTLFILSFWWGLGRD